MEEKLKRYKQLTILETLASEGKEGPGGCVVTGRGVVKKLTPESGGGRARVEPEGPAEAALTAEEYADESKDKCDSQNSNCGYEVPSRVKSHHTITSSTLNQCQSNSSTGDVVDSVDKASKVGTSEGLNLGEVELPDLLDVSSAVDTLEDGSSRRKRRRSGRTLRRVSLGKRSNPSSKTRSSVSGSSEGRDKIVIKRKRRRIGASTAEESQSDCDQKQHDDSKAVEVCANSDSVQVEDTDSNRTASVAGSTESLTEQEQEGIRRDDKDECAALEAQYEVVMVSTPRKKEAVRLARAKQLQEMRAREMREARLARALKRRGEVGEAPKGLLTSTTTDKKVSWREETSLVSVYNYSPPPPDASLEA